MQSTVRVVSADRVFDALRLPDSGAKSCRNQLFAMQCHMLIHCVHIHALMALRIGDSFELMTKLVWGNLPACHIVSPDAVLFDTLLQTCPCSLEDLLALETNI